MSERKVTKTRKDDDGDITHLCNPSYNYTWSPRSKKEAITDIDDKEHKYYVQTGDTKTYVHVVDDSKKGKYLRTTADSKDSNNLDNLPDC